jgi:beta-N-acetylhexosaminidase
LAAVKAGVASIMTAHVMFPALDPDLPATLSRPILHGLLRERLAFDGVIVSDDLEMKGVADHFTVEEMVEKGLDAGVDLFLVCHDKDKVERAVSAAERCVKDGRVPRARVEEALRRVAELKARFIGARAAPELAEAMSVVRAAPHLALAERLRVVDDATPRPVSAVDVS